LEAAGARAYRRAFYGSKARARTAVLDEGEGAIVRGDEFVMSHRCRWVQFPEEVCEWTGPLRVPRSAVDPFPYAKISGLELSRLLLQGEEQAAVVAAVKEAAPASLADLLAGEDWGVMDFSKMHF
jgi:hypothetical protein